MQDTAIAAIGRLQLEQMKDLEPVDLYIENMYPGREYDMILIVFELTKSKEELECKFKNIDIEKVSPDSEYKKYAYRKKRGSGGDVTFTTKNGPRKGNKKLKTIKNKQFVRIIQKLKKSNLSEELEIFTAVNKEFLDNFDMIEEDYFQNVEVYEKNNKLSGITFCFEKDNVRLYLKDFEISKQLIIENGTEGKYKQADGIESKANNKICSITGNKEDEVWGLAFPFTYSTVDKSGFISSFFKKANNWKNYPISKKAAIELEHGKRYIEQYLNSDFYYYKYLMIPRPLLQTDDNTLFDILKLLSKLTSKAGKQKKERTKGYEEYIQKMISKESNYFNLDLLFYKINNNEFNIKLMLEEILPSRFRTLFIEVPKIVNENKLYKNAITIKKEKQNLTFNFGIIKAFFADDFLEVVQKIFLGRHISNEYVFGKMMKVLRSNYKIKPLGGRYFPSMEFLKSHLLLNYLQELKILNYNKNYKFMDTINNNSKETEKKESFDLTKYKAFIEENKNFLDADQKIGVFSVGVLVRLLYNIQNVDLGSTPFEKKLKGYNLNAELLKNIYVEALEKIGQYRSFYAYGNLRDFINEYFVLKSHLLNKMSNNELSFYFVAGLELGNKFKTEKEK